MKTLLASLLLLAPAARAQDAGAPLSRAQSDAASAIQGSPDRAALGLRGEPDDDDAPDLGREPLGNFHDVGRGLFRSAVPGPDGYLQLKRMGFKTILNLQMRAEDERRRAEPEIHIEHVAMSGLTTPTFGEMDRALDVIASAPRPLLVHCAHGKDRTGFVIAAWRVTAEGMTIDRAVAEARSYGCCFVMFEDLAAFLKKYRLHRRALLRARGGRGGVK